MHGESDFPYIKSLSPLIPVDISACTCSVFRIYMQFHVLRSSCMQCVDCVKFYTWAASIFWLILMFTHTAQASLHSHFFHYLIWLIN